MIVNAQVSEETHEKVMEICRKNGISKSEYLKNLIHQDLENTPKILKNENKQKGLLTKLQNAFGATVKHPKKQYRYNLDDIWVAPEYSQKEYTNFKLQSDGSIKTKVTKLAFNINELYYLKEYLDEEPFTVYRLRQFNAKGLISANSLKRVCWNYQTGKFDELFHELEEKVTSFNYSVYNDYLVIDDDLQDINRNTICELISIINQKGYSEKLVYRLARAYPSVNPLLVRIVCMNHDNTDFIRLFRHHVNVAVENNPSKRRNLIMNLGGGNLAPSHPL